MNGKVVELVKKQGVESRSEYQSMITKVVVDKPKIELDELQKRGFVDYEDYIEMLDRINFTNPLLYRLFNQWQDKNESKEELQCLLAEYYLSASEELVHFDLMVVGPYAVIIKTNNTLPPNERVDYLENIIYTRYIFKDFRVYSSYMGKEHLIPEENIWIIDYKKYFGEVQYYKTKEEIEGFTEYLQTQFTNFLVAYANHMPSSEISIGKLSFFVQESGILDKLVSVIQVAAE